MNKVIIILLLTLEDISNHKRYIFITLCITIYAILFKYAYIMFTVDYKYIYTLMYNRYFLTLLILLILSIPIFNLIDVIYYRLKTKLILKWIEKFKDS